MAIASAGSDARLTGPQKAAVLVVALGEERAGDLFKHLSEHEVEALSLEIAKARKVPAPIYHQVIDEAVETVLAEHYVAEGGVDYARGVLERSLGQAKADEIITR